MEKIGQPRWKSVEYSTSQIKKVGSIIRSADDESEDWLNAIDVTNNWRASHAYPMHIIYTHLRAMANNREDIIVAERLKRLNSIILKLSREPSMNLWTMQDLGGCRFIVPALNDVYFYSNKYENSRIRHSLKKIDDYIKEPKSSGYRSLHMIYEYHSDKYETYNKNMLVEIQFRTHSQHVWATAVETLGLFTMQQLKAGQGEDSIKRFFILVSSLFALCENAPVVPETTDNFDALILEIKSIEETHHFLDMLSAIRVAVQSEDKLAYRKNGYYILILNYQTRLLTFRYFQPSDAAKANDVYRDIEKTRADAPIDAVLVRVSSVKTMKVAYPNYFLDIGEFISITKGFLSGKKKPPCHDTSALYNSME